MSDRAVRHRPKHWLEYLALRLVAVLLRFAPRWLGQSLLWLLARLAFSLLRFRRRETLRRIRQVLGPGLPPAAQRRIAWLSLRNIFFNAFELMRAGGYTAAWMRAHVENHDPSMETLRRLAAQYGGVVIALPHCGNWDLAGIAAHLAGIRIFSVAGMQRNRLVNDWINHQRRQGIHIVERGSAALRQIVRRLRQGEVFAILPDVRTRRPDLTIPFLGGKANLGRGMAQFARAAGVPILPVVARRIGWGRHRFEVLPPVHSDNALDKESDIRTMTMRVMSGLESAIRSSPEQWFWYNKRWVLEPLSDVETPAPEDTREQ